MNDTPDIPSNLFALGSQLIRIGERTQICGASDNTAEQLDRVHAALDNIGRRIRAEVRAEQEADHE